MAPFYFVLDPSEVRMTPACPFFTLTGLFCPGCGSQRAFHHMLHLEWGAAANKNLLLTIFLPLILVYNVFLLFNHELWIKWIYSNKFVFSLLAAILIFAVLRNFPQTFPFLAPS